MLNLQWVFATWVFVANNTKELASSFFLGCLLFDPIHDV
jgi:hypothetical protein